MTAVEQIRPRQDYIVSESLDVVLPQAVYSGAKVASTSCGIPSDEKSRALRNAKQELVFGRASTLGGSHGGKARYRVQKCRKLGWNLYQIKSLKGKLLVP